jgi:negative modulator of initiation of replication
MKSIEIDDELYRYLLSNVQSFGETPSETIRRLIHFPLPTNGSAPLCAAAGARSAATSAANSSPSRAESEITSFLITPMFRSQRQAVDKFLSILSWLYQRDEEKFKREVLPIGGRKRKYFSDSERDLMQSGSSVNPKLIPGSMVWVVTNNDTPKKKRIVRDVMIALGFSNGAIQLMEHAIG